MGWWGSGGRVFSPEKSEVSSYLGLLAIYPQREFESDFETALGVEGELTYLNVIVISNRNGKLFLHQTRVIARNTCLNSLLK